MNLLVRPTGPRAEEGVVSAVVVVSALAVGAATSLVVVSTILLCFFRLAFVGSNERQKSGRKATSEIAWLPVVPRVLSVTLVRETLQKIVRLACALGDGVKNDGKLSLSSLAAA